MVVSQLRRGEWVVPIFFSALAVIAIVVLFNDEDLRTLYPIGPTELPRPAPLARSPPSGSLSTLRGRALPQLSSARCYFGQARTTTFRMSSLSAPRGRTSRRRQRSGIPPAARRITAHRGVQARIPQGVRSGRHRGADAARFTTHHRIPSHLCGR